MAQPGGHARALEVESSPSTDKGFDVPRFPARAVEQNNKDLYGVDEYLQEERRQLR